MNSKMFRRVLSLLSVLTMLMSLLGVFPVMAEEGMTELEEMALIKERFAAYYVENASPGNYADKSQYETYLNTIKEDGSWEDIDYYDDTNTANGLLWIPKKAVCRMLVMTIAYCDSDNPYYQDPKMLDAVQRGLAHWRTIRDANPEKDDYEGPWCSNWWENGHGIGGLFYQIGVMLEKELTADNMAMICRKLDYFGDTNTGQNAFWATQKALFRALFENNVPQFRKIIDQCLCANLGRSDDLNAEALMVDNSFHAHGNLMYSNGYGKSLIQDLSVWIYYLRGTSFAAPQRVMDLMADYILDGNRWMIRGDLLELGTIYKIDAPYWARNAYVEPIKRMMASDPDPEHLAEYQILLDNLLGLRKDNGLSGNKDMWTSAYMSHMREGYGVNVRTDTAGMKSSEWRSNWPDGRRLCLVFWTTASMTSVMVDGDEYYSVMPTYDWRHLPGTTTPYYYSDRENDFDNNNDDSISVSNGQYGAISYVYEKTDIRPQSGNEYSGATTGGKLSTFFFDDEYVALGTDIHSNHKAPIHSTLNQAKADNVLVNGAPVQSGALDKDYTADYVYNNQIGYIFPESTAVKVSNLDQTDLNITQWADQEATNTPDTFTLYIDHGVAPKEAEYAYIVLPGATPDEVEAYSESNPIVIVANNDTVQAVRHETLKQTQVNFYEAGTLEYAPGKIVSVDGACSLIINESGATPVITGAVSNISPETTRNVTLTIEETVTRTVFHSKSKPYAGQSATLTAGDSAFITSGETAEGSLGLTFDGLNDTSWKANSAEDSWIAYDMQETMDLDSLTIKFGDTYATKYDILTSDDGKEWKTAHSVVSGDGGEDVIAFEATTRYWKLECKELSGNGGVEIKEIRFTDKDFAYATPEYPDMAALDEAMSIQYREDLYTEETLAVYRNALNKAKKLKVLPYATAKMVTDTAKELVDAGKALTLRNLGTVMTTLNFANPTVTVRKQTMGTPWTTFKTPVDLSERNLSKIYLFFTLDIELADGERSGMFSSGRILVRSANTDGKENNAYCIVDAVNLHEGKNIVYLPMSALNKQTNVMDWSDVSSFRMYIDSVNQYDMDMSFTFSEIQILDSENRKPDSPEKIELKQLLNEQKTDLSLYTIDSAAAYNELFEEGWKIYRDATSTDEAVNEILKAIKASDALLVVEENSKVTLGVLKADVTQSAEAHHMKVDIKADQAIDISGYEEGKVYVQFDFRVDTSFVDPAPADSSFLTYVKNGKVEMGETANATRTVVVNPFHSNQQVAKHGMWYTLRYPLPAELIQKGAVQSFFMFLYNDTAALGTDESGITWDNGKGVSFSVRNVKILADKKDDVVVTPVDKTALNTAISDAEAKLADGKTYTTDTLAALNAALTEAKGLADDADQTAVDNAAAKLNAAIAGLKEEPVVTVTLGDVNADSDITAEDALMALQAATNKIFLTADQTTAANVDKQDGVTANDALLILQFATKKIAQF